MPILQWGCSPSKTTMTRNEQLSTLSVNNNTNNDNNLYLHTTMFKAKQPVGLCTNQIKSQQNKFKPWFLVRGENRRTTSRKRVENQQTQSTYDSMLVSS